MSQEEYNNALAKCLEQMRELEALNRQRGDVSMEISDSFLKNLVESGKLEKELYDWHIDWLAEKNREFKKFDKFIKDNPDIPEKDRYERFYGATRTLSFEESLKRYEDTVKLQQIHAILFASHDSAKIQLRPDQQQTEQLFEGVDLDKYFGICNGLANALYYLIDLFESGSLKKDNLGNWKAAGEVKDSCGMRISLVYEFSATDKAEAEKHIENYKQMMKTKGILAWMSYWRVANRWPFPEFPCPLTEVMKCMSDENRSSRFDPEERDSFWRITRQLQKTKIKIEKFVKKNKQGNVITRFIEQPLIQILGGEEIETATEKYPLKITVRVLGDTIKGKDFAPALYKNDTTKLAPSDVFLAFGLQTRYGQKKEAMFFDWGWFFRAGNIQNTAKTNKRMAKAVTRKKMEKLKKAGISTEVKETKGGIRSSIVPFKKKKS